MFKCEKGLDNKIPWLFTKMHPYDLGKELPPLFLEAVPQQFFMYIYTHVCIGSYTQCHVNFIATYIIDNLKANWAKMHDLWPPKKKTIGELINYMIIFYLRRHF